MTTSRSTQSAAVVRALEQISHALRGQSVRDWVELDLTMAQLKTLFALEYGGAATIGQTADRLGISLPTASHLVDRLVQSGFVERTEDPTDRRRTMATVSEKGSELTRRLRQGGRESLTEWLAQLDDAGLEELARSISRLAEVAVAGSCAGSDVTPLAQAR